LGRSSAAGIEIREEEVEPPGRDGAEPARSRDREVGKQKKMSGSMEVHDKLGRNAATPAKGPHVATRPTRSQYRAASGLS
jgi:hypothetical protein